MNGEEQASWDRRDWLAGVPAIFYDRCGACRNLWYLPRRTCPHCGSGEIDWLEASGHGVVHARTLVHRAPTPELRMIVPYLLVFVDAAEGFRMMAHGEPDLAISDRVRVRFMMRAGRLMPVFRSASAHRRAVP